MKQIAWSYSSLTAFESCAKRYYHLKVAKDVKDEKGAAALWGSQVHKHLEDRVALGTPLPQSLERFEPITKRIADAPGQKLVELQLAVTSSFQPTEWFAKDAWCRGIIDVGVLTGTQAVLWDWKTGRRKPESDQLKLFAGLAFAHYPKLMTAFTGFIWMSDNKVDKERFERSESADIWGAFAPRVIRLHRAYEEAKFPPKPSGLCRNYCPVPKHLCEFSGKK